MSVLVSGILISGRVNEDPFAESEFSLCASILDGNIGSLSVLAMWLFSTKDIVSLPYLVEERKFSFFSCLGLEENRRSKSRNDLRKSMIEDEKCADNLSQKLRRLGQGMAFGRVVLYCKVAV